VPFVLVSAWLVSWFTTDPATLLEGGAYLRLAGLAAVFMAIEIVYEGAFAGAGDTLPAMAITLPVTAARIPAAWLLAVHTPLGATGVWIAIALSTAAKGLALHHAFAARHDPSRRTRRPGAEVSKPA